ncbi:MAG: signal recognition particle protein [Chloroflexi bacterium]|nr:signal recognition particle protein [Chloroflexota bacterium]
MPIFEGLSGRLNNIFDDLKKRGKLNENDVNSAMREIRLALLEADVHYSVVKTFVKRVKERAVGTEVAKSLTPGQQVVKIVHEELIETLGKPGRLKLHSSPPHILMLVGLQGSGKTTTAGKLALFLRRKRNMSPYLIAADTYRPAAIDQLHSLGKQLDIPVYSEGVDNSPPDIVERGLAQAQADGADLIIIDTAGRLQIDADMMDEVRAIKERVDPREILLVADAMIGQEAVNVAEGFNEALGITGLILTKIDGDARGGAAISMREVTGVPIKFLGTSEKMDGLEEFHPDRLANRILGMADVLTLIEKAESMEIDEAEAIELEQKLRDASFDLEDFRKQLQQLKKMGPLTQILELAGMGQVSEQVPPEEMDRQFKRFEAIINSMTPQERRRPKLLNASRRRRIATGSGTSVQEVNQLIKQFQEARRLMKKMSKGRRLPQNISELFR